MIGKMRKREIEKVENHTPGARGLSFPIFRFPAFPIF